MEGHASSDHSISDVGALASLTQPVSTGPRFNERLDDLPFQDGLLNVQKRVTAGNRPATKPIRKATNMQEQLSMEVGPCISKPVFPAGFYKGQQSRPNSMAPEVKALVIEELLPRVLGWFPHPDEEDESEIRDDLRKAFEYEREAYAVSKRLDDSYHWDVDGDLVEILDGADFYDAERKAVMAWIKDNDKKPRFEIGMVVTVRRRREEAQYKGEITKINEDGTYTIFVPDLGHVRQGVGTRGLIFHWEEVEALNP